MAAAGHRSSTSSAGCTISWAGGPILTDSGGFQVWSLGELRKITRARAPSPRRSAATGCSLSPGVDADSAFAEFRHRDALDECTPADATYEQAQASMLMSRRWAQRSKDEFNKSFAIPTRCSASCRARCFENLRRFAGGLNDIGFDGIAVGGLSVGESRRDMHRILDFIGQAAADKPHYLMGVGTPEDLVYAVGAARHVRLRDADAQRATAGCSRASATSS